MTLRVVHLASGREWRGGQAQVWLLARALAAADDLDQVVVTTAGSELARRLEREGIAVRGAAWRIGLDPRAAWAALRLLAPGSILHAHDAHALTLGALVARRRGARLVVTRRVTFPLRRPGLWPRADRLIAISHAVRAGLCADGLAPERIVVIPSGIAVDEVRATPPLPRSALPFLPAGARLAASVGALGPDKDHATLVRAAGALRVRLPDLHWVVAGEGPLRDELARLAVELGVADRVHWLGHLPDAVRLTAAADLFVSSSASEGLGTAVLEAMALGVPVVATDAGGVPETLAEGAGAVVPRRDPAALAGAVERVLGDAQARQDMVERAGTAVQRYTDRRMAEQVLSVYRSVDYGLEIE